MLELFDCSNVSVTFTQTLQSGGCENPGEIVRVYTATDDCGNESTFEQVISIVDNEGPVVEAPDYTVDCGAYRPDDLYPIDVADCALNEWAAPVSIDGFVNDFSPELWSSEGDVSIQERLDAGRFQQLNALVKVELFHSLGITSQMISMVRHSM